MAEALKAGTLASEPDAVSRPGNDNTPLMESATLVVDSMFCGVCIRTVETALQKLPCVQSARVNLSAKRVSVTYDKSQADISQLITALEGVGFPAAELADADTPEAGTRDDDLLRRLGVAGFAAANIMLLSVSVWAGLASDMGPAIQALFHWLSALIALPAVAYAGQPFFRSAANAIRARRLNMDVPISLGVTLATGMSLFQTLRGTEHVYFDAAVTLLFFLLIGRYLDQSMRTRAAGAAANLLGLRATTATLLVEGGTTERRASRLLRPGDRILVAAGERIAVDGRVATGESEIEESLITGETLPRRIAPSAQVYAGSVNLSAPLVVEATATDQGTLLAEIGRLMEAAEQSRGKHVRLADRAARLYAPAVHVLGLSTFIGWMLLGHGWEAALTAAIAVLIITCPCALALAVPAVQVAASSRLFGQGIIVKAADGLERLAEADTVVFDKTGTLTLGEPHLTGVVAGGDTTLAHAASLAATSRHPYSRALLRAAAERGIAVTAASDVQETPGCGLSRKTPAGEERLGSASWCGVIGEDADTANLWFRRATGSPVALRFEDRIRADAPEIVARLKGAGYHVELLSGDRKGAVEAAAGEAGIEKWLAQQTPRDKIARLDALKAEGCKVLMIGDGLNDAPALASGHASLSPSTAADISQTTADAIFQGRVLAPVIEILSVSRRAHALALQNFAIALGYNLVFVPLAVVGLVTPLIAAIAMSASSIAVTANAVRLRRAPKQEPN